MEIRGKSDFVTFGIVEEINIDVTDRIYSMISWSQSKNAWKIVNQIIENFLILWLWQLY